MKKIMVQFINPLTGESRFVKIGLSWTLFFFCPIVLLMRRLYGLWTVWFFVWVLTLLLFSNQMHSLNNIFTLILLVFAFFLFFAGNKITAKKYINSGFRISTENEMIVQQVKLSWNFPDEAFIKPDKQ